MTDDFWYDDVIDVYSDEQAVEDGVLIPVSFGIINRVTRTVLDGFAIDGGCDTALFDAFMAKAVGEFELQRQQKNDWFYKITADDESYFVVDNGRGFTLMKPEDY